MTYQNQPILCLYSLGIDPQWLGNYYVDDKRSYRLDCQERVFVPASQKVTVSQNIPPSKLLGFGWF